MNNNNFITKKIAILSAIIIILVVGLFYFNSTGSISSSTPYIGYDSTASASANDTTKMTIIPTSQTSPILIEIVQGSTKKIGYILPPFRDNQIRGVYLAADSSLHIQYKGTPNALGTENWFDCTLFLPAGTVTVTSIPLGLRTGKAYYAFLQTDMSYWFWK